MNKITEHASKVYNMEPPFPPDMTAKVRKAIKKYEHHKAGPQEFLLFFYESSYFIIESDKPPSLQVIFQNIVKDKVCRTQFLEPDTI